METVRAIAGQVFIPLTVGGGIRTLEDIRTMLNAGADKVSVNTAAVERPELISECAEQFGRQCVVLAVDAKRTGSSWQVYTHGGRTPTALDAIEWISQGVRLGAGEILLTSMDRDGTKDGFDTELLRAAGRAVDVPIIASGGAGTIAHCVAAVTEGRADAVLAASIFHRKEIEIDAVKAGMEAAGVPVRRVR